MVEPLTLRRNSGQFVAGHKPTITAEIIARRVRTRCGGDWPERFLLRVSPEPNSGCWLWDGAWRSDGYGASTSPGFKGTKQAHIVSWLLFRGPIPNGLFVLHRCDIRPCVNPAHLFLGTAKDNHDDCKNKDRDVPPPLKRGESHGSAKLTECLVRHLRDERAAGVAFRELARRHGLDRRTITQAINRETWAHVE